MFGLAAERGCTDRLDLLGSDWQFDDESDELSRHAAQTTPNHIGHRTTGSNYHYYIFLTTVVVL